MTVVTVVIPSRNRWKLLSRHALRAARLQADVDVEVVVVDDGSEDATADRIAALGDGHVRAVRHERRLGQAAARNTGLAETRTDWIAFLDDDDLWSPRKLRTQLDVAEAADADFAWCSLAVVDSDLEALAIVPAPQSEGLAEALLTRNVLRAGSSTVLARTDAVRAVGGFDTELDELADWDLWIRLALGGAGARSEEVLVAYVVHPGNRRAVDDSDVVTEYTYLQKKHARAAASFGVTDAPLHFSRWLAMGHRRRGERLQAVREYLASGIRHRSAGNFARAAAALVGEPAFAAARRLRSERPDLGWLAAYR